MTIGMSINDPIRRESAPDAGCAGRSTPFDPGRPSGDFTETFARDRDRKSTAGPPVTVGQVMTRNPRSCRPDQTLASAAAAMCEADCRFLPVVDRLGHPIGVVTDGDVCLLGSTDHRLLRDILVREGMSGLPATCRAEDPVEDALHIMRERRIRHLPVVDAQGILSGVLSLTDVILAVVEEGTSSMRRDVATTLRAIVQKRGGVRVARDNPFIGN